MLAVPILDTSFVVAKRLKYRQPIYQADRWHFHHRMANIGFSQRRTLAYLYGWTLVLAGLALALRFIPYSDDRGNFDPFWTVVMGVFLLFALVASVYVIDVLEILKLRRFRLRQRMGLGRARRSAVEAEVDAGVARELETGRVRGGQPGDRGSVSRGPGHGRDGGGAAEGADDRIPAPSGPPSPEAVTLPTWGGEDLNCLLRLGQPR